MAAIIGVMCNMVCEESAKNPSGEVAAELRRIVANPAHNLDSLFVPTPQEVSERSDERASEQSEPATLYTSCD